MFCGESLPTDECILGCEDCAYINDSCERPQPYNCSTMIDSFDINSKENFFSTYRDITLDKFDLTNNTCREWAFSYMWMRMSSEVLIGWYQLQRAIESESLTEPIDLVIRLIQYYPDISRDDILKVVEIFGVKYPIQLTQVL